MPASRYNAPTPDLRIVPTETVGVHEKHDPQRAESLTRTLRQAQFLINPPIVAPLDANENEYVILDGANRRYAFGELGYPHLLVQVTSYAGGFLELETWKHVVSNWQLRRFIQALEQLDGIIVSEQDEDHAITRVFSKDGERIILRCTGQSIQERHAALHHIVRVYQENAVLHRTTSGDPQEVWSLYPNAIALAVFPAFTPADIFAAARHKAYLPAGITRHIVHGRALGVNYPLALLRDTTTSLESKNAVLERWLQDKFQQRQVRYYGESTYHFNEYCEK